LRHLKIVPKPESKNPLVTNSHHEVTNGFIEPQQTTTTIMKKLIASFIGLVALSSMSIAAEKKDIVDTAAAGSFKTLVAAVKAAGLVDTLKGAGPFTVFAPTDEAFAKLPAGTVEELLKPENKQKLVDILTYHVVAGKVMAADVKTMDVKTVQGASAALKVADGKVTIDKANVVKTDIEATNGVIHVIDAVIMPAAK
jgi:transforming growth factor-beta-induced protein